MLRRFFLLPHETGHSPAAARRLPPKPCSSPRRPAQRNRWQTLLFAPGVPEVTSPLAPANTLDLARPLASQGAPRALAARLSGWPDAASAAFPESAYRR